MTTWLAGYVPRLWCVQKLQEYLRTGRNASIPNHILEYGTAIWEQIFDDERKGVIPAGTLNSIPYIVWSSFVKLNSRKSLGNTLSLPMDDSNVTRFFYEEYNDLQPFAKKNFFKFLSSGIPLEERASAAWELFSLLPEYEKTGFCSIYHELIMTGYFLSEHNDDTSIRLQHFAQALISGGLKEAAVLANLVSQGSAECVTTVLTSVFRLNRTLRAIFIKILYSRSEKDFLSPIEWLETLYTTVDDEGVEVLPVYSRWVFGLSGAQVEESLLTALKSFDTVKLANLTT